MKIRLKPRRIFSLSLVLLLVCFVVFCYQSKFRISDDKLRRSVRCAEISIRYYPYMGRDIRSVLVDRGGQDLLVLLHGAPSSCAQWVPLLNDSTVSDMVDFFMVDRPGYGYSGFGKPIISVHDQAKGIYEALETYMTQYRNVYLLGTSYGGTVGVRLMMDYPELFEGAVLVSSSMAPGQERIYSISYLMEKVPWLFPSFVVVANKEKMSHYDQLKEMEPLWSRIKTSIRFIHSTTDDLIYPENISYAFSRLSADVSWDTVWVKGGEHGLYWSDRELILAELGNFIASFR